MENTEKGKNEINNTNKEVDGYAKVICFLSFILFEIGYNSFITSNFGFCGSSESRWITILGLAAGFLFIINVKLNYKNYKLPKTLLIIYIIQIVLALLLILLIILGAIGLRNLGQIGTIINNLYLL